MKLFPSPSGSEFFWGIEHQTNKIPTSCVTWTTHIISSCLHFLIHKMNLYGDRTRVMEEVGGIKEIWLSQYHVFVQWPWVSAPVVCFWLLSFFYILKQMIFQKCVLQTFCHILDLFFHSLNNVFHCSLFHWAEVLNFNEVQFIKCFGKSCFDCHIKKFSRCSFVTEREIWHLDLLRRKHDIAAKGLGHKVGQI